MGKRSVACAKYLTLSCNLFFVVSGFFILFIGIVVQLNYTHYSNFVGDQIWTMPIVFIVIGSIVSFICCIGCFGALKENSCMIILFGILSAIVFLLEIGLGIASFIKHTELSNILQRQFNMTMEKYLERRDYRDAWSLIQTELSCCGSDGPTDWENILHSKTLPSSCCGVINLEEANECSVKHAHEDGCLNVFVSKIYDKTLILISFAATIAGIQMLTIYFAFKLCGSFRRSYEIV